MTLNVKCIEKTKTETQSGVQYNVLLKKVFNENDEELKNAEIKFNCNLSLYDLFDTGLTYEVTLKQRGIYAIL